jgi:hypothetical protein
MNREAGIDRAVILTITSIREWLVKAFGDHLHEEIEDLIVFVPWDLERNMPRVTVDFAGVSLDTVWIA